MNVDKTEVLLLGNSPENIIPHRYRNFIKKRNEDTWNKNRKRPNKKDYH